MKKKKLKSTIIIGMLTMSILLLTSGQSQAVLQANPNTNYKTGKTLVYTSASGGTEGWLTAIRKMEATGGAMGLSGSINESTLAGPSNGIDVHCMKSSEYGAMAILSASAYGHKDKVTTGTTTTGNKTGVYINTSYYEWTASVGSKQYLYHSTSAKDCYVDVYPTGALTAATAKKGDALVDCTGWHGGSTSWLSGAGYGFCRGGGSIFAFVWRRRLRV